MFERLMYLYSQERLTESGLVLAVSKGWITEEQRVEIIGSTAA